MLKIVEHLSLENSVPPWQYSYYIEVEIGGQVLQFVNRTASICLLSALLSNKAKGRHDVVSERAGLRLVCADHP